MNKREFIAGLGGALICSVDGQAQTEHSMPVIGFLSSDRTLSAEVLASFHEGLGSAGYIEDRNVRIEFRSADGHYDQLPTLVKELIDGKVNVLVVAGVIVGPLAAKDATTMIPIVFVIGSDPVRWGLVSSLNRPGGNVTGVTISQSELLPKRIEILREIVPQVTVIGLLVNPNNPNGELDAQALEQLTRAGGWTLKVAKVAKEQDLEGAFDDLARSQVGGLTTANDARLASWRQQIASLALRYKLPLISQSRLSALAGALIGYGPRVDDVYRTVGDYTGRILKGANPAELPVWYPSKYELVVNLKTAKALGLSIPPSILAIADEVIE
jgi:putative tryptophan/tyrosine transport system substrate-binding protein